MTTILLKHKDGSITRHDVSSSVINAGVIIVRGALHGIKYYTFNSKVISTSMFEEVDSYEL